MHFPYEGKGFRHLKKISQAWHTSITNENSKSDILLRPPSFEHTLLVEILMYAESQRQV
jgi:hypothetical protein